MKNHFPGLFCGNTDSLRPSKKEISRKSSPERHLEWVEQWHGVCKSRAADRNIKKTLARQKANIGLDLNRVEMAHESKSKYKEIYLGEQKNVGVNSMEFTALNKGETVGKGLGLVCRTKTSQSEVKGTATQNKTDREGLELVRGTKESQAEVKRNRGAKQNNRWRRPGTSARNRRKSIGRQRKPRRKTKQTHWRRPGTSQSEDRKPRRKTTQTLWRRPGTSARNRRKSIGSS